jgi:hypothetical protein
MDSMAKMAGIMATMMGVIPKPATQSAGDLLQQLEVFAKLKELFGSGGGDSGSGAESNFFDVVKTGLQSFGPALSALALKNAQNVPAALPAPAAPPVHPAQFGNYDKPAPAPRQAPPGQGGNVNAPELKRQVDTLVQNAKMGVDPGQLAEMILRMTPDEKLDDLGNMLDDPEMIPKMAGLNPEVNNYRDFFEKLRDALLSLLDDTGADTLPPNAPNGGESAAGSGAPGP